MRALIRFFGILTLVFAPAALAADEVAVPPLKARITDLTGTLNAGELAALEAELRAFEQSKGSRIAVLMLPSTQPETIEQYSMRVGERWKIGRAKADDGVILIIAKNDQRLRIEVGYGLEGVIPDVVAKRVIREVTAPHLLANDFHGGIRDGTQTLMKLIEGEKLPAPARARTSTVELFGQLRVWDTEHNSGVLIYLLLADRRVEIVADRGIHNKVAGTAWEVICGEMQRAFAAGRFEHGVIFGVGAISDLLATHFPRGEGDTDELPNEPVVL